MDSKHSADMAYQPGDHLAIFPSNKPHIVNLILSHTTLEDGLTPDDVLKLEVAEDQQETFGEQWADCSLPCSDESLNINSSNSKHTNIQVPGKKY